MATTFSRQDQLPSLPVPPLKQSLAKYLKSASALLSTAETTKLASEIKKFEESELASQLQSALENRAKTHRNWLEDWWYNAYTEIRSPLAPNVSFGALNPSYTSINGGQLSRAADVLHHWIAVWDKIRNEKWPITSSRGVTWDMAQFHNILSSNRTPHNPRDTIDRFFKTKSEGACPHHVVICCNGSLWKVNILNDDDTIKTPDQLYAALSFIRENSVDHRKECVSKLTTQNRDVWSLTRDELLRAGHKNLDNLHEIESSILFLTLVPKTEKDQDKQLHNVLLDESWYVWQDKSVNILIYEDGQVILHGDHSNVDAIVLLQIGDYVAGRVRKELWHPSTIKLEPNQQPSRLDFELNEHLRHSVAHADVEFYKGKQSYRAKAVHFHGYGNDLCRTAKIYTDTVVQIALQLAYAKTHGLFAPIYETASSRKFFHGRTETVRGCTQEFVEFGKAVFGEIKVSEEETKKLFEAAINAHNQLMTDCMEGNGFDRHIMGLKKTLEIMNRGCGPKRALPAFLEDETWRRTGGDGNFLLSTSFIGYMPDHDTGTFGYVAAMRHDGYGCFYRIGKNRISVAISDWSGSRSNIDAFGSNVHWALDKLSAFLQQKSKI